MVPASFKISVEVTGAGLEAEMKLAVSRILLGRLS